MTIDHSSSSQELKLQQAAKSIKEADFLLIATGAGFSADSGLPTYADVAKNPIYERLGIEYGDLCRLQCLRENPKLFYGFWGTCFNLYQRQPQFTPHEGYQILKKWCDEKQIKNMLHERSKELNVAWYYLYTSNVDGHFRLAGFPERNLHEVHGAIDTWIPTESDHDKKQAPLEGYSVPESYSFPVDPNTLEGPSSDTIVHNLCKKTVSSGGDVVPSCVLLRPRVLMFDDGFSSHAQMGLNSSGARYQSWEEAMESTIETCDDKKLVVLEIGCGTRVPSVRIECQDVIQDTAARCNNRSCCSFIRINPDEEEITNVPENVEAISIRGKALSTLVRIDEYIGKLS